MLHEFTGLLVPPGDSEALAVAVMRVLNEPELVGRMTTEARALAPRRFGADRLAQDMATLYEELLATK